MSKPVRKVLVCLADKSIEDLHTVTSFMELSHSEAIRMGLSLLVSDIS
jgi:hypothetical protein